MLRLRAPSLTLLLALLARPLAAAESDLPALPIAQSNNAVAVVELADTTRLYSFMGLGAGKTWRDIDRHAFEYDRTRGTWQALPPVPVERGRLAAVAATAGGKVYLFGGYTVAEDGHEVSTPEVLRFDPVERDYQSVAGMPTPVDDSVALVWRDRWIYLISGWHMDANVALVQVYDTHRNRWRRATDYPGVPVFGHAGAILEDSLLVCDGVRLDVIAEKRQFSATDQCWRGEIDHQRPTRIAWRQIASHPGPARYRMGAAADPERGWLLFAGGSDNPYNYDGIGYDQRPSTGSDRVQAYDLRLDRWLELAPLPQPSMDHRGLLRHAGRFHLIGGMRDPQRVSPDVLSFRPTAAPEPTPTAH